MVIILHCSLQSLRALWVSGARVPDERAGTVCFFEAAPTVALSTHHGGLLGRPFHVVDESLAVQTSPLYNPEL